MKFFSIKKPDYTTTLLALLLFSTLGIQAQNLSQSPYGRYALGDNLPNPSSWSQSLGGSYHATSDSSVLNLAQPASLTSIARGVSIFEGSIAGGMVDYKTSSLTKRGTTAGYSSVALAFPIVKKRWTAAIHLMPITNMGYTLRDSIETATEGLISYNYNGSGGISAVGLTNSLQIYKDLAIGAEMRYIFGKSNYITEVNFPDQQLQIRATKTTATNQVKDFDAKFGLTYQIRFRSRKPKLRENTVIEPGTSQKQKANKDSLLLKFGFTFKPSLSLTGNYNFVAESFFGSSAFATVIDTVFERESLGGKIIMPMQYGAGLSLSNSNKKWMFTADYRYTDWASFKLFDNTDSVRSSYTASAGIQFIPQPNKGGVFKSAAYRLGGYYSDGMLRINGNSVPEFGVSLGVGLPFTIPTYYRKPVTSMMNIALSYGQRGSINPNLLSEQFYRLSISFSLNDRWFVRTRFE